MSEKHLTELPWKTLAIKQKLKDPGLGKALMEFGNCEAKDVAGRIKWLDTIEKHGEALKKEQKKNEEVAAYLAEILKESDKARKSLELLRKGAGKTVEAETGEEEEESSLDLKGKLLGGLKKAKQRKPADPPVEAMVCKAGKSFAVLLAKKVGSGQKTELQEILKGETGHKFVAGTCEWGEPDVYTFVLETLPSGAAKGLKAFLKEQTKCTFKIKVRDLAGAVEEDLAGEGTEMRQAAADPAGDFNKRLAGLLPRIKDAIAKAAPAAQEIKLKASEAGLMANKKDFARANSLLDEAELMLNRGGSAGKAPAPGTVLKTWQEAKDAVDAQLNTLFAKLKSSRIPQVIKAADGIEAVMENYRAKLITALMAYEGSNGGAKEKARAEALNVVTAYQAAIPKDKHIIAADTNPFQVKVTARQILGDALATLSKNLQA